MIRASRPTEHAWPTARRSVRSLPTAVVETSHPVLGLVRQVSSPFALGATPAAVRTPPPLLGEHTAEILAGLGYGPEEVERLRAAGTV